MKIFEYSLRKEKMNGNQLNLINQRFPFPKAFVYDIDESVYTRLGRVSDARVVTHLQAQLLQGNCNVMLLLGVVYVLHWAGVTL